MWKKQKGNKKCEDSTAWARKMNRVKSNIKIIYKDVFMAR